LIVFFLMAFSGTPPAETTPIFEETNYPTSWSTTKKRATEIHEGHEITIYCGCEYTPKGASGGVIDHSTCEFLNRPNISDTRAVRLEWEHIVPASLMPAREHSCWIDGSRSECERNGPPEIKAMIFDLHNLVPSVGQVNADRSNLRYGEIEGEVLVFGRCDFEYSRELGIAEPAPEVRGDVARVWFYMRDTHGVVFTPGEEEMFQEWSEGDPVGEWEIERNRRIYCEQGTFNSYISDGSFKCGGE
ncbi:MAG: endonuclease, partial [Proteobacteria bacterium]|nr:endonuclease [Pseudomonadota bacterium]